jgi:hypothetical protein
MTITALSDTHNQHNNIPSKYLAGGVFLNASVLNARYVMSNLPHEIEITK